MKNQEIINLISRVKKDVEQTGKIKDAKKTKVKAELEKLHDSYKSVKVKDEHKEIYKALVAKGKSLADELKKTQKDSDYYDTVQSYIRYLKAAKADFEGKTAMIQKYYMNFILTSMLFFALSPQYFGFILPMIFFVPIFLGIKGIKNRSINGLYMSLSVVPVALMTSSIWIRYGLYAISNYQEAINKVIMDTGRSLGVAKLLVLGPPSLAVLLTILAISQIHKGLKTKDLFV